MAPKAIALALAAMLPGPGATGSRAAWMGRHFDVLKDKTLLELSLPGSHNSGNYQGGLHSQLLCASDYRYSHYLASVKAAGAEPLSQSDFDERMIPWNVNHRLPIAHQLREDGARFFHLKTCAEGDSGAATMDLEHVRFQHRGYTTKETLASTLREMLQFLEENPKEMLVLGFNNLHRAEPGGFTAADVLALSRALVAFLGPERLVLQEELANRTLQELLHSNRRFLVFMGGPQGPEDELPSGILPSARFLAEHWDDVMASGDLQGAREWLVRDVQERATDHSRFYVMQANPNNAEELMFKAMMDGKGPQSNEAFLEDFLRSLPSLVAGAAAGAPGARLNAVSSDFLATSRTYDIAMALMGLQATDREEPTS